jgi:hypothetical protein
MEEYQSLNEPSCETAPRLSFGAAHANLAHPISRRLMFPASFLTALNQGALIKDVYYKSAP